MFRQCHVSAYVRACVRVCVSEFTFAPRLILVRQVLSPRSSHQLYVSSAVDLGAESKGMMRPQRLLGQIGVHKNV